MLRILRSGSSERISEPLDLVELEVRILVGKEFGVYWMDSLEIPGQRVGKPILG